MAERMWNKPTLAQSHADTLGLKRHVRPTNVSDVTLKCLIKKAPLWFILGH